MDSDKLPRFAAYVQAEFLGHRRLAGHAQDVDLFGSRLLRLDVTLPSGRVVPQYYAPSSIFCITPTTMECAVADRVVEQNEATLANLNLLSPPDKAAYEERIAARRAAARAAYASADPDDDGYNDLVEQEEDDDE